MATVSAKTDFVPTIACINYTRSDFGMRFDLLIAALQKFIDECLAPVWGTPAKLTTKSARGAWTMAFFDDPDESGAVGYHDLTKDGSPLARVFVKPCRAAGIKVSVAASQELAAMLIDPTANLWADTSQGTLYAYDPCNPVDGEEFLIDGIAVSDFVYPAYFESFKHLPGVQFDYLKKVTKPFQILKGGYVIKRKGNEVTELFASTARERSFRKEDRRYSRNEYRK